MLLIVRFVCESNKVSDHLPLFCDIKFLCDSNSTARAVNANEYKPSVNWSDNDVKKSYLDNLAAMLDSQPLIDVNDNKSKDDAVVKVNHLYQDLCDAITRSSESVMKNTTNNKKSMRKSWWNADCKAARDRL